MVWARLRGVLTSASLGTSWVLPLWGESTGAGEGLAQPVRTRRRSKPTCPRARNPVTHCSVEMCVAETAFEDRHFFGIGGGCLVYLTGMRFHWPHYWSCSQERAGLSWLFIFFSLPPVASPFRVLFKLEIGKNLFFLRLSSPVLVVKWSQKQEPSGRSSGVLLQVLAVTCCMISGNSFWTLVFTHQWNEAEDTYFIREHRFVTWNP